MGLMLNCGMAVRRKGY